MILLSCRTDDPGSPDVLFDPQKVVGVVAFGPARSRLLLLGGGALVVERPFEQVAGEWRRALEDIASASPCAGAAGAAE